MIEESYAITEQLDAIEGNTSDTVDLIDTMPESIARAIGTGITINASADEQSSRNDDNEGRSGAVDNPEDPDVVEVTVIVDSETGDVQPPPSQSSDRDPPAQEASNNTDTTEDTTTTSTAVDTTDTRESTESEAAPTSTNDASAEQSSGDESQPEPEPTPEITIDDIPLRDESGRFRTREERESMAAEANANRREEEQQRSLIDSIRESVVSGVGGLSEAGDTEEAAGYAVGGSIYGAALEVSSAVEELRSDDSLLGKGFKKVKKAFGAGGGGFMSLFRRNQEERSSDDSGASDDSRAAGNEDVTDAISDQSEQIEEQTEETRRGFKDVVAAIKGIITGTGTGGDLIDSALDMFGGGDDRNGRGSRGGSGGSGARGGGRLSRAFGAARDLGGRAASVGGRALSVGGKALGALAAPVAGFMAYSDKKEELESRTDITESQKSTQAISTGVGAGGGALAGAATGAAIGSVIPVIGTAIGGIVGGLLGAYGGEMIGSEAGKLISGDTASEEDKQYSEKKPEEQKRTPMEQALYEQGQVQAENKTKEPVAYPPTVESKAIANAVASDAEQPLVQSSAERVTAMPVSVKRATKEPEKQDPNTKAIAASLSANSRSNGAAKTPLSSGDNMKPVIDELKKIGKLLGENPDKTESGSDNYINPNFSDPLVELMAHDRI